jgi:hypothetical protein
LGGKISKELIDLFICISFWQSYFHVLVFCTLLKSQIHIVLFNV